MTKREGKDNLLYVFFGNHVYQFLTKFRRIFWTSYVLHNVFRRCSSFLCLWILDDLRFILFRVFLFQIKMISDSVTFSRQPAPNFDAPNPLEFALVRKETNCLFYTVKQADRTAVCVIELADAENLSFAERVRNQTSKNENQADRSNFFSISVDVTKWKFLSKFLPQLLERHGNCPKAIKIKLGFWIFSTIWLYLILVPN